MVRFACLLALLCAPSAWADCTGKSTPCTSNANCPGGTTCILSPAGPCHNACVSVQNGCTSAASCGPCGACSGGTCQQPYVVPCEKDADCSDGGTCKVDPGNPCKNVCLAPQQQACKVNDDCSNCWKCISGFCKPPLQKPCTQGGKCPEGQVCKPDPNDDPCYDTCVDGPPPEPDAGVIPVEVKDAGSAVDVGAAGQDAGKAVDGHGADSAGAKPAPDDAGQGGATDVATGPNAAQVLTNPGAVAPRSGCEAGRGGTSACAVALLGVLALCHRRRRPDG